MLLLEAWGFQTLLSRYFIALKIETEASFRNKETALCFCVNDREEKEFLERCHFIFYCLFLGFVTSLFILLLSNCLIGYVLLYSIIWNWEVQFKS